MTSRESLLALARRCETEEASRELDELIAVTAFDLEARPYSQRTKRIRTMWWYERATDKVKFYGTKSIPAYTSSLDAAVGLVPEWLLGNLRFAASEPNCVLFRTLDGHHHNYRCDKAATPALAICAASLRALAALVKDSECLQPTAVGENRGPRSAP